MVGKLALIRIIMTAVKAYCTVTWRGGAEGQAGRDHPSIPRIVLGISGGGVPRTAGGGGGAGFGHGTRKGLLYRQHSVSIP